MNKRRHFILFSNDYISKFFGDDTESLNISEYQISEPPNPPERLLTKYKYLPSGEKHACVSHFWNLQPVPNYMIY